MPTTDEILSMPLPPDVILSISPRLARLLREVVVTRDEMDLDPDAIGGFVDVQETRLALDALVAEIDSQLSRKPEKGTEPVTVKPIDSDSPAVAVRGQQAADIAAKMAKSARKAAEGETPEEER